MAAAFVAATAGWFYARVDVDAIAFFVVLGVAHVVVGYLVGRWWAILLPVAIVLALVPESDIREIPPWFGYLIFASWSGAILLAAGVWIRRASSAR